MQSAIVVSLGLALLLVGVNAKFNKDEVAINSRIPGDQLLWHSSHAVQNLDFFATVRIEVRYPQDKPHSDYMLSHALITGKDDTGYVDVKFDAGGPGSDSMRMKMIFNSIKNGDFEVFLYGKKK